MSGWFDAVVGAFDDVVEATERFFDGESEQALREGDYDAAPSWEAPAARFSPPEAERGSSVLLDTQEALQRRGAALQELDAHLEESRRSARQNSELAAELRAGAGSGSGPGSRCACVLV
jgi:hypothetical protein